MAERRPYPASPRRRAVARAAGLHAASPLVSGAVAGSAGLLALVALGPSLARSVGSALADACRGAASWSFDGVTLTVVGAILPIACAIAIAALVAHVAQTRTLWLPRRRITGAPVPEPRRVARAAFELGAACVVGATAFGWIWVVAPRLAHLVDTAALLPAAALALAALATTLLIAWIALAVIDAIARHLAVASSLAMTAAEKREDDRLAGADPRWRERRARVARGSLADAIAGASVILLGDGVAVAIAWDPVRRPIPTRTAIGTGARATQIVALARRHVIAVHRDTALAHALADREGTVPDADWARLAEIIAAVRGRPGAR